jgi:serine-type D-Ala-D-Ala carboxypeptidase
MAPTTDELARRVVLDGVAPACAAGCAIRRSGWHREAGGATGLLFDLASLTKPMTAAAVACSGVDRAAPLGRLLPEARHTASERVPIELFLAHRAGLEANLPLYAPLLRAHRVDASAALREAAGARREGAGGDPPAEGFAPLYSDLGYILAGEALARTVHARDAGEAIDSFVLEPLGISKRAGTVIDLASRGVEGPFAPTETVDWRGGAVLGAVHDENAWALTGEGGSGHAGIFGTVDAVLAFGVAVLDSLDRVGPGLGDVDVAWLVRPRPGGTLRAGFDGRSEHGSAAGDAMGARTFGHLGFTGTSLWIDPDAKVVTVLLTNRVCPTRASVLIRSARPSVHQALFERAQALVPETLGR